MIAFTCRCGNKLSVDDSEAGGLTQCPQCGLLLDVPHLDELPALKDDGTLRLADEDESAAPAPPQHKPKTLDYVGGLHTTSVDRRLTLEQYLASGVIEEREGDVGPGKKYGKPRYDPITGELVRPFDLADEAPKKSVEDDLAGAKLDPNDLPTAQLVEPGRRPPTPRGRSGRRTLGYARGDHARELPGVFGVLGDVFKPANLLVVLFVFAAHVALHWMTFITVLGGFILGFVVLLTLLAIIAHYGNVVEETGSSGRDELPTPLRHLHFYDDFMAPLFQVALATVVAWGPYFAFEWFVDADQPWVPVVAIVLNVLALVIFPATLLTTTTSGSVLNLAPHRVLGVIWQCGFAYLMPLVMAFLALLLYGAGGIGSVLMADTIMTPASAWVTKPPLWATTALAYGGLLLAVICAHAGCWMLGRLYRRHHEQFPWVLQRHISTRHDPIAELERLRRAGEPLPQDVHNRRASDHVKRRMAETSQV